MTDHWDAVGVAFILVGVAVLCWWLMDRAYTRSADGQRAAHRALRDRDRAAYWRLYARYKAVCTAGVTVEQAAAEAAELAADAGPIPYDVIDPYRPVWTTGALLDDHGPHGDFGAITRAAFKEVR